MSYINLLILSIVIRLLPQYNPLEINDNDLLRCSSYFNERDITRLIGALDDPSLNLVEVQQRYSGQTTQIVAYRILQKWLQAHPNTSQSELKEKFEVLGFSKAAKK